MKKDIVLSILALLLISVPATAEIKDSFIISGSVNVLLPADSDFSDIYGDSLMLPEFTAYVKVSGDWFGWASYGFLSEEGTTPVFESVAKSTQNFLFAGAAYRMSISDHFKSIFKLGLGGIFYKEEALDTTIEDSALGIFADCGLFYDITEYFSLFISAGYIGGSDTVNDVDISLGGFKVGIGLAVSF